MNEDSRRHGTHPPSSLRARLVAGALAPVRYSRHHLAPAAAALAAALATGRLAQGPPRNWGWLATEVAVLAAFCCWSVRAIGPRPVAATQYLAGLVPVPLVAVGTGLVNAALSDTAAVAIALALAAAWWLFERVTSPPTRRGANSHHNADGSAKIEYTSRSDALDASKRMTARDGARMSAYRCERGGHWHIGHAR